MIFSEALGNEMVPLLRMPHIEDEAVLEILSDYVSKNTKIYNQVLKLESYLETEFVLPNNLTYADRCDRADRKKCCQFLNLWKLRILFGT